MKLYFKDSKGKEHFVAEASSEQEAWGKIHADVSLRNPKFDIRYVREWTENDCIWYDVGSWSEFYILKE